MPPTRPMPLSRPLLCLAAVLVAFLGLCLLLWPLSEEVSENRALNDLRAGGYVIYLRHADRSAGPKESLSRQSSAADFANCGDQRNLTPRGRENATEIGNYMRESGIPVGRVIANAQCRTRDTALLAFGRVELDPRVFDTGFVRDLLTHGPPDGRNLVIVGNDQQMRELAGINLGFGEAAIIRPEGERGFELVARFDLEDWREAAAEL